MTNIDTKKNYSCQICDKQFPSNSTKLVHTREKHTFKNSLLVTCKFCNKEFHSVVFNTKLNKRYLKCEECRDLQSQLNTKDFVHNTYVYNNQKERFFVGNGTINKVCGEYTCSNSIDCNLHNQLLLTQCNGSKCNNCYIQNGLNQCDSCITRGHKSKNKLRDKVKQFKEELGGKCVGCDLDDLFFLEFDHIDSIKKTVQITRSAPSAWINEKENLELRCGRCHRMKTEKDRTSNSVFNCKCKHCKCKTDKKEFVKRIKTAIGGCQLCEWTLENKDQMCCALDFDHISGTKYKQISNLYTCKKETIVEEILKTRLLCRHCHELHTCLQRGGKALKFYYTDSEIKEFESKLNDPILQQTHQNKIRDVINQLLST